MELLIIAGLVLTASITTGLIFQADINDYNKKLRAATENLNNANLKIVLLEQALEEKKVTAKRAGMAYGRAKQQLKSNKK